MLLNVVYKCKSNIIKECLFFLSFRYGLLARPAKWFLFALVLGPALYMFVSSVSGPRGNQNKSSLTAGKNLDFLHAVGGGDGDVKDAYVTIKDRSDGEGEDIAQPQKEQYNNNNNMEVLEYKQLKLMEENYKMLLR